MKIVLLPVAIGLALVSNANADKPAVSGPFGFEPLTESAVPGSLPACAPFNLPKGFGQYVVLQENGACPGAATVDAVAGQNDLTDMNTVNETGAEVGRFLYRTHENGGGIGALSAMDLYTGETSVVTDETFGISPGWSRLDGLEWTPWGTLLAAEENGAFGRMFECEVDGIEFLNCELREAVGLMSHEGIAVDGDGNVYVGDELNGGSIYKFVPDQYGDLSSGTLYALNIPGSSTVCSGSTGVGVTPMGAAEWLELDVAPGQSARDAADLAGASDFCRPEDAEIIGPNLYFATTTTRNVLQIPLNTATPYVTEYFGINTNVNNESDVEEYGLYSPDNLASDTAGNLYIVEDNSPADIWVAGKDLDGDGAADDVSLFATLTTPGAEGTGIYFARTMPGAMFVNVQHAADGNDMTVLLVKEEKGKGKVK